jgi:3-deoxy-D-manno-octulosonic-acid transferase
VRFLYRNFLYPFAFALLKLLRPFVNEKTRKMIEDKEGKFFEVKTLSADLIATKRPFWIHAASGEIEYARPVIRELKNRFPDVPVIVTYSSPSAKGIIRALADVDAWGCLPWDFEKDCLEFLEKWQPRCWLIARTDVWPVMAECCHKKEIPSLLFSATFASNSSRLRGPSAKITAWALNQLSEVHCVSDLDVKQLNQLFLQVPVHVHGDTRFDQVFHRLQNPKPVKNELRPDGKSKVLVAGSTWSEDEKVLLHAFHAVKDHCKMILAPHEISESHLKPLCEELKKIDLSFCLYSQAKTWHHEDVLILDQVGILAELYTWGNIAFVGGSFKKQVHSVMEPLAAGLPVLVGPYHHNNREALIFKEKLIGAQAMVVEVSDIASMGEALAYIIETLPGGFSTSLKQELSQHMHSSRSVVEWCGSHSVSK